VRWPEVPLGPRRPAGSDWRGHECRTCDHVLTGLEGTYAVASMAPAIYSTSGTRPWPTADARSGRQLPARTTASRLVTRRNATVSGRTRVSARA